MRLIKTAVLTATCILIMPVVASAITMDTVWTTTFWRGYFDSTNCVQETSDGGFIIVGVTRDTGEVQSDIELIKTYADGTLDWSKEIGDTASECGFHVLECVEGGYLVSARSSKYGDGAGAAWIIRTDEAGDTLWTYPFAPEGRNGTPLYAMQTADSGFAITGLVNLPGLFNDAYILLLDGEGNFLDYAHYGGPQYQDGRFITEMSDGGFIVTVWTNDAYSTQTDFRAFRTTRGLDVVWDSTYVVSESTEEVYGACRVNDGIVLVGNSRNSAHALKIDFEGHTIHSKSISISPTDEQPRSVCPTSDGGLMVGGWVGVTYHRRDFCFIKLDSALNMKGSFTVGGSEDDHGNKVLQTADGDFVMAGTSYSFYNGGCNYLVRITRVYNTTVGTDVAVPLDSGVTLVFDDVTGEGDTDVAIDTDGPPLPQALQVVPVDDPVYYNITTSAAHDGMIEVCISYNPADVVGDESDLTLMHYDGASWVDITSSIDEGSNIICGTTTSLSPFAIAEPASVVGLDDPNTFVPADFGVGQNYPNPFNPSTSIEFSLPEACRVTVGVFNLLGGKVVTLIDEVGPAGLHRVSWDGMDAAGRPAASGVYFYRFAAKGHVESRKMLLLR